MRRTILAVIGTVTGLVTLLTFKTHAAVVSTSAAATASSPGASTAASAPPSTATSAPATTTTTKTVTGDTVDTRWGPVQVQITVSNGKITAAQAVQYPQSNPRDEQINAYAVPVLNQEAVTAGSASIDMVSGATYTSDGYITSLQSALNKVGS